MRRTTIWISLSMAITLTIVLGLTLTAARQPASPATEMTSGKVPLTSAGALAFGPTGILFVGDSIGGSVAAIDTEDVKAPSASAKVNIDSVDAKIAAMVGIAADQ